LNTGIAAQRSWPQGIVFERVQEIADRQHVDAVTRRLASPGRQHEDAA